MRQSELLCKVRAILWDGVCAGSLTLTIVSLVVAPWPVSVSAAAKNKVSLDTRPWTTPLSEDRKILHLLNRVTFGPRPGDAERVGQIGTGKFLDEQLHPERIDDSALQAKLAALPTLSMDSERLIAEFKPPKPAKAEDASKAAPGVSGKPATAKPTPQPKPTVMSLPGPQRVISELAREEVWSAVYSNRQLQEVMVQFWMNHFNIFAPKGADRWLMTSFERDAVRPRALSKFEDLIVATAESPAMLFYLDNWMSRAPNGAPGPPPDKTHKHGAKKRKGPKDGFGASAQAKTANPGRRGGGGLNENYGRELMELHTLGVDGGYTQKDVVEVSRCFTGWTIEKPQQQGTFAFNPKVHDYGEKRVLGHRIRAGRGKEDGLEVLRILARHPSTAHFISLKLCRRFIADDPPPSAVDRAAKTFLKTHGDIRKVLKTILTSPEFYSEAAFRAKVKSPLELVASSLRALGADTDADLPLLQAIQRMGQPMFQYEAPTGFPDRENTWINSGTLLARMNFASLLVANRIPGTQVKLQAFEIDPMRPEAVMDALARQVVGGELARSTRQAILAQVEENSNPSTPARVAPTIAGLLIASPEFQRR